MTFDPQGVCSSGTSTNERWYTGTHRDMATGDYTFGSRVYDPSKASFTSSDTYSDRGAAADVAALTDSATANTYAYVNGDALNAEDLSGHTPCPRGGQAPDASISNCPKSGAGKSPAVTTPPVVAVVLQDGAVVLIREDR